MSKLTPDELGRLALDGIWDFFPGGDGADLDRRTPVPIAVPALWEAQGFLELDGVAWYRRRFELGDVTGHWTLEFGAVMDIADVWLNGTHLGAHDNAFLPFAFDVTGAIVAGTNTLLVRVDDPSITDPEHMNLAHGKQGWANHVFPSRPSLYMTYGGIWQSVVLHRHGALAVRNVRVDGDPSSVGVDVSVLNTGDEEAQARVLLHALGRFDEHVVDLEPGVSRTVSFRLGATSAARWTPETPVLHTAMVDVVSGGDLSDTRSTRFGLRRVEARDGQLQVNDEPFRVRGALVQGFRADGLYAEGTRQEIEDEVRLAKEMGFNTLRLHIKAFDPRYLDICDELGMLAYCDIPVAEPIDYDQLGADGESTLATRAAAAVRGQIARDTNHPSVLLWSLMNELGYEEPAIHNTAPYERFARSLVAAARSQDGLRPIIENDWIEPEPEHTFGGDVLTAHWYGRLHREYLAELEERCRRWADVDRPLIVSEYGDWGLPEMPEFAEPPFWDTRAVYAAALAGTLWPGTLARFVRETQRYQGLSDRLQGEVFRRHDHIAGYVVTELTDVPFELNGLLDLRRRVKPLAAAELRRLNQPVLPIVELDSFTVVAGDVLTATVYVANDGPALDEIEIEARFGSAAPVVGMDHLLHVDSSHMTEEEIFSRFRDDTWATRLERIDAHQASPVGTLTVRAPSSAGAHDLVVRLSTAHEVVAANCYPIHVLEAPSLFGVSVRPDHLSEMSALALEKLGADHDDNGLTVIGEHALDEESGRAAAHALARGETVLVLAQEPESSPHFPVPLSLVPVATMWGSSVFHFTTDNGALPSLPRRNVLVAEDSTIQATSIVTRFADTTHPDTPVVLAFKPVPDSLTGTVVGSAAVSAGRLVFCQYRVSEAAAAGDAAARGLLADLVRWAAQPRPVLRADRAQNADGRHVARYRHESRAAQ
jgi:hypothetical protein